MQLLEIVSFSVEDWELFFDFRQASDERMPTSTRTKSSKPSGTR